MDISEILSIQPYSLNKAQKEELLNSFLASLSQYHYLNCESYRKMMDSIGFDVHKKYSYYELPFLPVRLFKMYDLCSVPKENIVKTMTSSGTTGQAVSRIFLDKETSSNQTKSLNRIVSSFIGTQRVPMIIIDTESVIKNRNLFSARGAGILGFSMFGIKRIYALDEQMNLDIEKIKDFIDIYKDERIFIFGFTFIIYQHFYKELLTHGFRPDLSKAILIHGGGWKKLAGESVSSEEFRKKLNEVCGLQFIHDYYGMVEQTGTIYMECEQGHLHAPVYSDVIIRRPHDFSIAGIGEKGIVQVVSVLPKSYPGHSLLTEDEGILLGEDDCPCGRLGKYFKIIGRIKNAEIRGCSDTYAEKF
ncbi:MAG TPA: acyl-protein synthetase [Bacteroidales bacterium]|nr:acyl-protein synthetase [Bacteroidales bacterium]HQP14611.1 acyl-protein synthetase [Bacteroidales bacterium]